MDQELEIQSKIMLNILNELFDGFALCKPILNEEEKIIDFEYINVNEKYLKFTNKKKEHIIGKRYSKLYPDNPITNKWVDEYKRALKGNGVKRYEMYFEQLKQWFEVLILTLDNEKFITTYTNISKRKRIESDLLATTKKIQNQKKELEDFSSTVSHDLRGKLQIIRLLNDLGDVDSQIKIEQCITEMTEFLNNLLKLAKKGTIIDDIKEIDLNTLINAIIKKLKILASNIDFNVKDLPKIIGSEIKIKQIFENIILNIIKHAQATKVTISVEKTQLYWKIIIDDNGIGMSQAKLDDVKDNIFHNRSKTMGLIIVNRIVEEHKGFFDIRSKEGKGTTMMVSFPDINKTTK